VVCGAVLCCAALCRVVFGGEAWTSLVQTKACWAGSCPLVAVEQKGLQVQMELVVVLGKAVRVAVVALEEVGGSFPLAATKECLGHGN
jgi:hypothetical protein